MIKNSKGISAVGVIVGILLVLIVLAFVPTFMSMAQKGVTKIQQTGQQQAINANLAPKPGSYSFVNPSAIEGELTFSIIDNNNKGAYVTDFSPISDYAVKEDGIQTTVDSVHAYPVAYVAVVVDPDSANTANLLGNLSNLSFENAYVGIVSMVSSTTSPTFESPTSEEHKGGTVGGPADYWGALATAAQSLPTVTTRPDIGPNFLGVILVSDGRCDAGTDICTKPSAINQALNMPANTHFYLLTSNCLALSENSINANMDILNHTLESYSYLKRASCDTNIYDLLHKHLLPDMATITLEYTPLHPASLITQRHSHNITVTVTKRTGPLGLQSAYSGTTTVISDLY